MRGDLHPEYAVKIWTDERGAALIESVADLA